MKPQRKHTSSGALFWLAFLPLIFLSRVLSNWIFLSQTAFAAPTTAYSAPGHLTAQQYLAEGQAKNANKGKFKRPTTEPAANKLDKFRNGGFPGWYPYRCTIQRISFSKRWAMVCTFDGYQKLLLVN